MSTTTTAAINTHSSAKATAAATAAAAKATSAAKAIVAKRFKTTLCATFEKTGRCPYVSRCMFAHGRRELRTAEQNVADGLTTDEAIKEWKQKRAEQIAAKKRTTSPKTPSCCSAGDHSGCEGDKLTLPTTVARKESPAPIALEGESTPSSRATTPVDTASLCASATDISTSAPLTPNMHFITISVSAASPVSRPRGWRHDPYAAVSAAAPVSPLALAFSGANRSPVRHA